MNELAGTFGYADLHGHGRGDHRRVAGTTAVGVTVWQREAAYPLYFLNADRSKGAHNPTYAKSLLQNAIDYYDEHIVVMN